MIRTYYECNGCGITTTSLDKRQVKLNELSVDLTNYLLFTSGFKMKYPFIDIIFCNECFSKITEGSANVANFGEIETMRKNIADLEKQLEESKKDFTNYKCKIQGLLK